jgi:hypothetical protein
LIWQAIISAVGAGGAYTLPSASKSIDKLTPPLIAFMLCLCVIGCASKAEVANVRETLWQGTDTIRARDKAALAATTSPSSPTNPKYEAGMLVHKELEDFVKQSRSHDNPFVK